ncbi:TetR/AcrR family transcriptional regulator [Rhizobium sp. 21-4511-3d]
MAEKSGRSVGRREMLLKAAAEVFFEQGYASTSIDAIIERAGGSKRNIYNEFGSKEGLFAAIVRSSADSALSSLSQEQIEGRGLEETLTAFGQHLMEIYMSPTVVSVYRIAINEANRFPDLARSFYEQGPGRAASQLAEVLEFAAQRGEIEPRDYSRAAGLFVGMIRDNLHLQVVLGLRSPPLEPEVRRIVSSAVDIFLNGVRLQAGK